MCRKSQLQGWALIALSVGIVIGSKLEDGFLITLLWIGALVCGFCALRKK